MDDFISFIGSHYKVLLYALCVLVTVVFNLIRKRPVLNQVDQIKADVLEQLPIFITMVESPGNGDLKKAKVLDMIKYFVKHKYKIDIPDSLLSDFSAQIEEILKTPQKGL